MSDGGIVSGAQGRGPPRVMPVTVPVAQSPGAVTQQIQQVDNTLYAVHFIYAHTVHIFNGLILYAVVQHC